MVSKNKGEVDIQKVITELDSYPRTIGDGHQSWVTLPYGLVSTAIEALEKAKTASLHSVHIPEGLHPATTGLILLFASRMAEKLSKVQDEKGKVVGWTDTDWKKECQTKLLQAVEKGDPVDVANYCAFMFYHGWSTNLPNEREQFFEYLREAAALVDTFPEWKKRGMSVADLYQQKLID